MKKRFLSKSLIAKIALVLVIILVFEFAAAEPVHAASLGGTLLNPIVNLVVYLADGVIQILQSALTSIDNSFAYIDISKDKTSWWVALGAVVGGLLIATVAILATIFTGGAAAAIVAAVAPTVIGAGFTGAAFGGLYLAVYPQVGEKIDAVVFGNSFVIPTIGITPETILKNQIKLFDVNYFKRIEDNPNDTDTTESLSQTLRNVVAQVYTTIRDVALVAMLIVIIYIAIRMLLALTPKEKSRYKESAVNCVIGLVLIITMHFIMSVSVSVLEMITNSITFTNQIYDVEEDADSINNFLESNPDAYNNSISGVMLKIAGDKLFNAIAEDPDASSPVSKYPGFVLENNGEKISYIKASNFTEQARYMAQKLYELDDEGSTIETWAHIGWAFVYIMLVILTLSFVLMYAKRTLYMAALTIFAPIVGIMYPINRANGGRSQTLNLWFKEYMGNLIIQPFHLLLYTIFIGSAMQFAIYNPVYVIIAIMGLMFVERLLKDLLGIQDTRIGGLGKSLQDTTRAIKTTEKAATSIARTVGRTVSRGTHALGRGAVGLAGLAGSRTTEDTPEEGGVNNINSAPRVQNPPLAADFGGGQNEPPPTAGAQNPEALNQGLDNNTNQQPQQLNPQQRKLDQVASMRKYFSEGGRQNELGEYFNPYTDEFDPNYNPLNDPLFQVNKGVDEQATMQKYLSEGGRQNTFGEYFRPDIDEFEAGYNPLNDPAFQVYKDGNVAMPQGLDGINQVGIQGNATLNGIPQELDEALTMQKYMSAGGRVNENGEYLKLDSNVFDANYDPLDDTRFQSYRDANIRIAGGVGLPDTLDDITLSMVDSLNDNGRPFEVLDGTNERVVRSDGERNILTDDNGHTRIERVETPNGRDPMAMAMAAGSEMNNIATSGMENIRTVENTGNVLETGSTATASNYSLSNLGSTAYVEQSGAQNIPDGNNVRVNHDLSNSKSKDKIVNFEPRAQEIREERASAGGNTTSNNENTENVHRLTADEYEEMPPSRDNFAVINGGRTNAGASSARPRGNSAPQNTTRNPEPLNNNAPQNNTRTPSPANNPAPQDSGRIPTPANDPAPQNNRAPVGAGPVSDRNQCKCATR